MSQTSLLSGLLPPLTPAEYVRLRRMAVGLTIAEAARPHWHRPEHRADVERSTAALELPGAVLRDEWLVDGLLKSFPIDPAVYRQLRDEPPEHHPAICRGCGCTAWQACNAGDGMDCTMTDSGQCTACEERANIRQQRRRAA